jgi:hypothetical protein
VAKFGVKPMTPARWILFLFAAAVAWVPVSVHLGTIAAQDQDAAGKVIYSYLTTLFLLMIGSLALGIPALLQVRNHPEQVSFIVRVVAWMIVLSPLLIAGGVIFSELIGHFMR